MHAWRSQSVRCRCLSTWSRSDLLQNEDIPTQSSWYFCFLNENVFHQKIFGKSKRDHFPNHLTYNCVNDVYSGFIYKFVEEISFISPARRIRSKANSKSWFGKQIILVTQRRDNIFKKFKHSSLKTDKDSYKVAEMHLQKMILTKRNPTLKKTS